jgi:acetyl-CoA carboxylase carboxyltransferase component
MKMFKWFLLSEEDARLLAPIKHLLPDRPANIYAWLPTEWDGSNLRKNFDGVWTVKIETAFQSYGIMWNDFKIFGGSFGVRNSTRLCGFLSQLDLERHPLFMSFNTIGVRIMEGRQVFPFAFKIIPSLISYSKNNMLITSNHGKCLGIGALLYILGHYRMALKDTSLINLTGPEVFKMFFGVGVDFDQHFNSKSMQLKTSMIHEIHQSNDEISDKFKSLIGLRAQHGIDTEMGTVSEVVLDKLFDSRMEIFSQKKCNVVAFIARKSNIDVGVVVNPLGKGNMIDTRTISKYRDALKLFKRLNLPLISIVDTPGADPRSTETENGIIGDIAELTAEIIDYPHPKIGVTAGRCYGGASVLMIPTIYGGAPSLAIKGSHMGIMGKQIIRHLLSGSQRFLEMWEAHSAYEEEMRDLLEHGLFEGEFDLDGVSQRLDNFLFGTEKEEAIVKIQNGIQIKIPMTSKRTMRWQNQ